MSNFTTWRSLVDGEDIFAIPDSGLFYHVDATDTSTITESNGDVTTWEDISGNNRDFEGIASSYDNDAFANGNHGVYFDFDSMDNAFTGVSYPVTFCMVVRIENPDTTGNFEGYIRSVNDERNTVFLADTPSNNNRLSFVDDDVSLYCTSSYDPFSSLPFEAIMTVEFTDGESNNQRIRVNGDTKATDTETNITSSIDGGINLGETVAGNDNDLKGTYVGEYLMYDRLLNSSEVNSLESTLADKWGIPLA